MQIKLTKNTIVNGEQQKKDWAGEVTFKEGSTLISMGKAEEIKEDETVEVGLVVDVKNSEEFEQMQKDLEFYKEERASASEFYSALIESLKKCTNIQCVKELLEAQNGQEDEA